VKSKDVRDAYAMFAAMDKQGLIFSCRVHISAESHMWVSATQY